MLKKFVFSAIVLGILGGCSSPTIHGDKKVTAASSSSMPDWVKDSERQSQKRLAKAFDDDYENPKSYYLVSQAHVDNESLVPSCYNFARSNAANELASSVTQDVNGTVSSASDTSSDSHYAVSTVQTKTALVGSQIIARYWDKTESKDRSEQVNCWLALSIPMKNYNQLKSLALKKASKTDMDKAVQDRAEKSHTESAE
jgi:hypothetical protein